MKESNKQFEQLNKPVNPFAWVDDCFCFFTDDDYSMLDDELKEGMIPLYTAPHHASDVKQTKRLSDEQILNIWLPFATDGIKGKIEFARAIEKEHGIK